jgi:hypothetical protein
MDNVLMFAITSASADNDWNIPFVKELINR